MRAVLQRVGRCSVTEESREIGRIDSGLLVYLGIGREDTRADVRFIADKVLNTRVFQDAAGKMNLSVMDAGGSVLVVSQFTLYGDVREGRRPSFTEAAAPEKARELYEEVISELRSRGVAVEHGRFAARMDVTYTNEGPVTILVDSQKRF
jgi:D-tyrosyl-tRNA(Tyr) deacylase